MTPAVRMVVGVALLLVGVACGGIERPQRTEGLLILLDSQDPSERAWAVTELTRRRSVEAVPGLIRRLRDPDGGIRLYAGQGLKELTGQDFGFRATASADEREAAVAAWEAWYATAGPLEPIEGAEGAGTESVP